MNRYLLILLVCAGFFVKGNASTGRILKDTSIQKTDTLNIMISEANHMYYYVEPLQPDASNFNVVDYMQEKANMVMTIIVIYLDEAKRKDHQLIIFLKLQKESSLNESSKKAIDFIKQWNYKQVDLKEVEKELIRITEQVSKDNRKGNS